MREYGLLKTRILAYFMQCVTFHLFYEVTVTFGKKPTPLGNPVNKKLANNLLKLHIKCLHFLFFPEDFAKQKCNPVFAG